VDQKDGCEVNDKVWEAAVKLADDSESDSDNDAIEEDDACSAKSTDSQAPLPVAYRCLFYLLDTLAPPASSINLIDLACESDNVAVLQLLHQRRYPLNDETVLHAAKYGSWACLQYLHKHCNLDCWVPSTMAAAAGAGQLELVKQLHETDCPWDESAPIAALHANKADCLQFFLELRGVPTSAIFQSPSVPFSCWMVIHKYEQQQRDIKWKREQEEYEQKRDKRLEGYVAEIVKATLGRMAASCEPKTAPLCANKVVNLPDPLLPNAITKEWTSPFRLHDAAKALRSTLDLQWEELSHSGFNKPTGASVFAAEASVSAQIASDKETTVLGKVNDVTILEAEELRLKKVVESLHTQNKHEKLMSMYHCIFTAPGTEQEEDW